MAFSLLSTLLCFICAAYAWTSTPFLPTAIPLAVRSPYFSAWLPGGEGHGYLAGEWPQFWNGDTLGWVGYVTVDGQQYIWLGQPGVSGYNLPLVVQTAFEFTSTQSIFTLDAGPVTLTVNFLSPIPATDLVRLSIPFSYMTVSVAANDGGTHSVQLYTDISAEWTSGDDSNIANWTTITQSSFVTHQVSLESQTIYGESGDRAEWGSVYYVAPTGGTYQTGEDSVVRAQFLGSGTLTDSLDTNFRAISDDWPVFAHAFNLGTVGSTSTSLTFAIGFARDPAIEYIIANDVMQNRRSYFFTEYSSMLNVIEFFLGDYSNAVTAANAFDASVSSAAGEISSTYQALTAISARQAVGACELTYGTSSSDIMYFLKEISSDGNVNTVDVIFPMFPILVFANPELIGYILLPLLAYQATGQYPNKWAAHDIGSSYPVANGHNAGNDEAMPVEESGNMIIMMAAYLKATSNQALATTYYSLLQQWTTYLIDDSLIPANQLSTDDFAGTLANQTNLAIKGIAGIAAMAQLSNTIGETSEYQSYLSTAQSYVPQFQSYATSKDGTHLDLSYGNDSSWGTAYNMYADRLLGLGIFPESIYQMQTDWYRTVTLEYGLPLDVRHTWTMTPWEVFASACVTSTSVRDTFLEGLLSYLEAGETTSPWPDLYQADNAGADGFIARPVVGGAFAHLALQVMGTTSPYGSS